MCTENWILFIATSDGWINLCLEALEIKSHCLVLCISYWQSDKTCFAYVSLAFNCLSFTSEWVIELINDHCFLCLKISSDVCSLAFLLLLLCRVKNRNMKMFLFCPLLKRLCNYMRWTSKIKLRNTNKLYKTTITFTAIYTRIVMPYVLSLLFYITSCFIYLVGEEEDALCMKSRDITLISFVRVKLEGFG